MPSNGNAKLFNFLRESSQRSHSTLAHVMTLRPEAEPLARTPNAHIKEGEYFCTPSVLINTLRTPNLNFSQDV